MVVSNTCVSGNDTITCVESGSPVGLAVGLTLFFLLLVIIACIIVYKYCGKTRMLMQLGQSRSQKNEDFTETPQAAPHQYTSMSREQSTGQIPIYENLTAQTAKYKRHAVNQSRYITLKVFSDFNVSPRWQHLFLFWELFRGNFVAKITFMKVQQKRLERKQMKKHCGVNFPNWISPIFTQFCCAGTILLASKGALLSFCFYTMWMCQSDVQADDSARKFFLCE